MNLGGAVRLNKTRFLAVVGVVAVIALVYVTTRRQPEAPDSPTINLRELLAVALLAARRGAREVVENAATHETHSKGKTREGADDSVTTADLKSHCVMTGILNRQFPRLRVVSEESTTPCERHSDDLIDHYVLDDRFEDEPVPVDEITVWIDPLDATQEYTEKLYRYVTVMVCVAVRGRPVIGIVHEPFANRTTWAWSTKGHSSNLDIKKAQRSSSTTDNTLKFVVSRSHAGTVEDSIRKLFSGGDGERAIKITRAGGAGYKVLELVNDKADVYFHVTAIKKWDVCAGDAILNALGGRMLTVHHGRRPIDYADADNPVNKDGLVATFLHAELI